MSFGEKKGPLIAAGSGSGFVVDSEKKWIVTCYHVIRNAEEIKAIQGDKTYELELLVMDKKNDLAMLRMITEDEVDEVVLGAHHKLRVGQRVFAIGSPYGLENTATFGRISALKRQINIGFRVYHKDLIQTDCPINPGNSGGALFNMNGELIGVPSIGYRGGDGIGAAIPAKYVKNMMKVYERMESIKSLPLPPPELSPKPIPKPPVNGKKSHRNIFTF